MDDLYVFFCHKICHVVLWNFEVQILRLWNFTYRTRVNERPGWFSGPQAGWAGLGLNRDRVLKVGGWMILSTWLKMFGFYGDQLMLMKTNDFMWNYVRLWQLWLIVLRCPFCERNTEYIQLPYFCWSCRHWSVTSHLIEVFLPDFLLFQSPAQC